jgi:tetratricopeptide (TPR) repeat protein
LNDQLPSRLLSQATHWLQAGRPDQAIPALQQAAHVLPGNAAVLHDLGLAYLECGRIDDAVAALKHSIAIDPALRDSHLRLGIALEASDADDAALRAYERASEVTPLADAIFRAANLLDNTGHANRAIEMFRRAADCASGTVLGRLAMARALLLEDRNSEAEKVLRKALTAAPGHPVVLDLLGHTLAELGRFTDARRYFLKAIDRAPALAGSYYEVTRCARLTSADGPLIVKMQTAVKSPALEPAQRFRVHLALGKAADDLGEYENAMRHFAQAEAIRNGLIRFDPAKFEARVEELIARNYTLITGLDDPTPILIIGLPRSGTTLVEQILSAHPDVAAGGELSFWNERGAAGDHSGAEDYIALLREIAPHAARVTDKMPFNFQWAGLIHQALPRATLIHCRRNPLDTALSIHQTHFNPRMGFPTGGEALVVYIKAYERLCDHWRRVLPTERFVEVEYETLTAQPEPTIRRLVAACGLPWNDRCMTPERNARAVKTASKWQARQPIYQHSVGRWKRYESFLGPLRGLQGNG